MKTISLTQGKYALVDDEDFININQYKWRVKMGKYGDCYACANISNNFQRTSIMMHRLILGLTSKDSQVDHINGNGFDNRKKNLRLCNCSQNQQNRKIQKHSSRYKGVCWHKRAKKWESRIKFNGESIHLGVFIGEINAAITYNNKAKELFGEFARLNNV